MKRSGKQKRNNGDRKGFYEIGNVGTPRGFRRDRGACAVQCKSPRRTAPMLSGR